MDIAACERPVAAPVPSRDPPRLLRARLATIKGRNLLFSSSRKAIYGLNVSAADIWGWLEQGASAAEAGRRLEERGLDPLTAETLVRGALAEWERLGLIVPRQDTASPADGAVSRVLSLAGVRLRVSCSPAHAGTLMATLRHLEASAGAADIHLEVIEGDSRLHLLRNGEWLAACLPEEAPPVLRAQLLAEALDHSRYELALHAASMLVGDRLLLLCGPPGAGKTTLSLGLAHAGFGYCADDVTLLDASALCTGLPLAPSVKHGSWSVLERSHAGLADAPIFRRPDGTQVRYPVPDRVVRTRPTRVGWIVLLHRRPGESARLVGVDPVEALQGILADAYARQRHLTDPAFDALVTTIERARIRRLVYAGLEEAVDALREWCR